MNQNYWATQSPVTNPGKASTAIDELLSDLACLRNASSQLIFHYRAGDFEKSGVSTDRMSEIALRYADEMLKLILSRGDATLTCDRQGTERVVGCCRDSTVLFLALARHKGIAARGRVGFASFCMPGWWLDHMVAEVWDEGERRWRLVDPQMGVSFKPKINGIPVDWLDMTEVEFLTGPQAWLAARAGQVDPERFVVSPTLDIPFLRSWPYLAHNVLHDLASLDKTEMLLWDVWGMQERLLGDSVVDADAQTLDEISAITSNTNIEPAVVRSLMSRDELRVPDMVMSADPNGGPTVQVDISRAIGK
jgi:hypothetical protein